VFPDVADVQEPSPLHVEYMQKGMQAVKVGLLVGGLMTAASDAGEGHEQHSTGGQLSACTGTDNHAHSTQHKAHPACARHAMVVQGMCHLQPPSTLTFVTPDRSTPVCSLTVLMAVAMRAASPSGPAGWGPSTGDHLPPGSSSSTLELKPTSDALPPRMPTRNLMQRVGCCRWGASYDHTIKQVSL
jgi:hypothetical protein